MAQRVVDVLEVVDIDKHHRKPLGRPLGAADCLGNTVLHQRPVRQACECVVKCQVLNTLFNILSVGDVTSIDDDSTHLGDIETILADCFQCPPFTFAVDDAKFDSALHLTA